MGDLNPLAERYMGDALVLPVEPLSDDAYYAIKDAISTLEKAYMRLCKPSAIPAETLSELKVTYLAQLLRLETIIMTEQQRFRRAIDKIWDKAVPESAENPVRTFNTLLPLKPNENKEASQTESQEQDTSGERDLVVDETGTENDAQDDTGDADTGDYPEF